MPINKRNAPVPVPSHGISELARKSASGLCLGLQLLPSPPIPVLSPLCPCPLFPLPTCSFFPFFPHLRVRRSSLGMSGCPHSPSHWNAAAGGRVGGVEGAAQSVLGLRAHRDRNGKLLGIVSPFFLGVTSRGHLSISQGQTQGRRMSSRKGTEHFHAGFMLLLHLYVSPASSMIGDLHSPNQMDFPPGCL